MKSFLRYGSHSEKRYYQKMSRFFDGVVFAANLLEASPSATSSLILKISGSKNGTPYIIDPMTYSFGQLKWITSEKKDGSKLVKRSYEKLANSLGGGFESCVNNYQAIQLKHLTDTSKLESICEATINYQKNRVREILGQDEELTNFPDGVPQPAMIFAPYFFISQGEETIGLDILEKIAEVSMDYEKDSLYLKLCFDKGMLLNERAKEKIYSICEKNFKGVWLWIDNFDEKKVSSEYLAAFSNLVNLISNTGKEVFNRHGGFYAFALYAKGMTGVSNAIGYGEHKNIVPVVGSASPTVNYYHPALHSKFGIPDIEKSFDELNINSPEDFFKSVCDCVVCRGVIKDDISNFKNFGTRHLATEDSKKPIQTPAAAERSRYHYLFCKIQEKKMVRSSNLNEIVAQLEEAYSLSILASFREKTEYIQRWINVLKNI